MTRSDQKLATGLLGGVCGIYAITSPSGKAYIGSSVDIRRRWYEHHWRMKNGKSSSPQLDRAYAKYGLKLRFEVLELCCAESLRAREQWYLDQLKPSLNVSTDAYCAALWAAKKGAKFSSGAEARRRQVEDSAGKIHESIASAATAMGCSESAMRSRIKHHDPFPCGLRFKAVGEEWGPLRKSESERRSEARISASAVVRAAGGRWGHSEEAKREKSERTRGVPWGKERRDRFDAKRMEARGN